MEGCGQSNQLSASQIPDLGNVRYYNRGLRPRMDLKRFGPELGFTNAIHSEFDHIFIAKYAAGGKSIDFWLPNADGSMGPGMNDLFYPLKFREDCIPAALFWLQGETDATNKELASTYYEKLVKVIMVARERLSLNIPVFIGRINSNGQYVNDVRAAQEQIANEIDKCFLVDLDGLTKTDSVHYDTESQLVIGERFAEAYLGYKRFSYTLIYLAIGFAFLIISGFIFLFKKRHPRP